MLELRTTYTLSQVPYISYEALDQYAEDVIRDAMPKALCAPTALDVGRFIEFYLNMQVEYKRLSYDRKILGMTAFNTGIVQVFDDISSQTMPLIVQEGTVIIDPLLTEKRNIARRRFTFMHEGAHWLIHRPAFAEDNPFGSAGVYENQYLAAKEGRIDYSRSQKERNDIERIERQADFLASALLMPKVTLRMAFREFFKYYNEKPRAIVRGKSEMDDLFSALIPEFVSGEFGVSKRAALIRLEKLGGIVGKQNWRQFAN
ncbi:MAG: ImmA/IrrE family metallo-endopeptidase [Clostridiales bacterium]|nr:ImmA/IrrE family metallo-endopeptidase [Clostridiales bacterium]